MEEKYLLEICNPKQWKTIPKSQLLENGKFPVYGANGIIGRYNEYNHEKPTVLITCRGATCGNIHITVSKAYINGNAMALDNLNEIICKKEYLYYFLEYYDMSKIISGTAQPQITITGLKKVKVKLYSINKQKEIVNELNKINKLIELKERQLEELQKLIKSQFVEMFGDIHLNDKKWKKFVKMNEICEINPKKNEISNLENVMVSFVTMQSVTEDGEIYTKNKRNIDDVKLGFTYFRENDVLFAKITPCMENGKGAVAVNLENKIGFGSTEFHVIRPGKYVNPLWIYTLTVTKEFRKQAEMSMTGSAGQKRVSSKYLENYRMGVPPITLQNQFSEIVKQIDKQKFESMIQLDKENRIVLKNIIKDTLEETNSIYEFLFKKYFEEGK